MSRLLKSSPLPHAVGYLRVSTEDQAQSDRASLSQQEAAIRSLAQRRGFALDTLFTDPGASGGSADRPGFLQLMTYCAAHKQPKDRPAYVLVLNDSRWGRFSNPEEATYWRVHLQMMGWLVRFSEGDESEDVMARGVLRAIHSSTASAHRENIKATAKRGAMGSAAQGYWCNEAPFGYRRREIDAAGNWGRILEPGQRKSEGLRVKLVPGPKAEVAFVQRMFREYTAGREGLWQLVIAAEKRFPGRFSWCQQTIGRMLQNRTYLGEVVWGRRPHDAEERARQAVRPADQWVVTLGAHEALIDADTFAEVQRIRASHVPARRGGRYLLTGLLTCSHCGDQYRGGGGSRRGPEANPDRNRFYLHASANLPHPRRSAAQQQCPSLMAIVKKQSVEKLVIDSLLDELTRPTALAAIASSFDAHVDALRKIPAGQRKSLEREKAQVTAKRDRLVMAIAEGTINQTEAKAQMEQYRQALARLESEIHQSRFGNAQASALADERSRVLALVSDMPKFLRRLDAEGKRDVIRPWIQGGVVDRKACELRLQIRLVPAQSLVGEHQPGRGSR